MTVDQGSPSFMQPLHTDEYRPAPLSEGNKRSVLRAQSLAEGVRGAGRGRFWSERRGTATGLIALNDEFGAEYFAVPREAIDDEEAAGEALGGDQVVIDVQTHYLGPTAAPELTAEILSAYKDAAPSWWKGLDGLNEYNFAEYLRCVFLESENAVVVLTSNPGLDTARMLFNDEMAGTRRLLDELAPAKRMLQHAVVHPNVPEEFEMMEKWRDEFQPAGWKVYTLGRIRADHFGAADRSAGGEIWDTESRWMLDDESTGIPFLNRVRELGGNLVCVHKGLSSLAPTGSPRDVGPAAKMFPDLNIVVYHSGYEWPTSPVEEGAYSEEQALIGTNRLIKSLLDAKVSPGENVYAELGTTWYLLLKRPREAAHVIGKLLKYVGEDNILWGTDSCFYGPTQPLIDAFRAFQIPEEMRQRCGYPPLTATAKNKILSLNAAKVYGVDLDKARDAAANDDLAWIKSAVDHYRNTVLTGY